MRKQITVCAIPWRTTSRSLANFVSCVLIFLQSVAAKWCFVDDTSVVCDGIGEEAAHMIEQVAATSQEVHDHLPQNDLVEKIILNLELFTKALIYIE